MTSAYSINLNFNNTIPVKTDFTFKQGDKGITLNLATIGLDTTGTTARIVFKRSNGTSVEAELTGQTGPSYSYTILGNEFEIPGVVVADLKLYNGDTQRVSTASFIFLVTGDTMDGVGGGTGGYSDQLEELSQEFAETLQEYQDAFGDVGAINPRGEYSALEEYTALDLVSYNGNSYLCREGCTGIAPTNTTYWQVFAAGGAFPDAEDVNYDNTTSQLTADNVQEALDELAARPAGDGSITAERETNPALKTHSVGDYIRLLNDIYIVTSTISVGDSIVVGTNVSLKTLPEGTTIYTFGVGRFKRFDECTDAEIAQYVAMADAGLLDLYEDCGWDVGQERQVSLSAINSSGTYDGVSWSVGESQSAQTATLVLMHRGLYELNTPVLNKDGTTRNTCSFVVGLKNSLSTLGYMNPTATNANSWDGCARRAWCNGGFRSAIPVSLQSAFKQFKTTTANAWNGSTNKVSIDYFALPATKEVGGYLSYESTLYSVSVEYNALTTFAWYQDEANRIKKKGDNGAADRFWKRSPSHEYSSRFCFSGATGGFFHIDANEALGLSPFGCI